MKTVKNGRGTTINKDYHERLLKEYELSQNAFYEMEKNTWQTASVFVFLSIGGVSLLLTLTQHSAENLIVVTGIGIASSIILSIWLGVTERWWSLQTVLLYRMEEIEAEIGMWKQRYIDYLDTSRLRNSPISLTYSESVTAEKDRFQRLDTAIPNYSKAFVRKRMRLLVRLLIVSWLVLIMREILLTFPILVSQIRI